MNVHVVVRYLHGAWVICHSAAGTSLAVYADADAACERMSQLARDFPGQQYAVHESPVI